MKRRARRPSVTYELPWSPAMLSLFDLVKADWTAPDTVKVRRTARGMTVTALVATPAGVRLTARARLRLQGDDWFKAEEVLGFSSTLQGVAA